MKTVTFSDIIGNNGVFIDGDWVESKDQDPNGEVRLLQLADIGDGYFINKSNRFLTKESAKKLRCTFLEAGDILYIPALWFHNVTSLNFCVSVNLFWKQLESEQYQTKDLYGNKDLVR